MGIELFILGFACISLIVVATTDVEKQEEHTEALIEEEPIE